MSPVLSQRACRASPRGAQDERSVPPKSSTGSERAALAHSGPASPPAWSRLEDFARVAGHPQPDLVALCIPLPRRPAAHTTGKEQRHARSACIVTQRGGSTAPLSHVGVSCPCAPVAVTGPAPAVAAAFGGHEVDLYCRKRLRRREMQSTMKLALRLALSRTERELASGTVPRRRNWNVPQGTETARWSACMRHSNNRRLLAAEA